MAIILERLEKLIAEQLGIDKEQIVPSASLIDDLNIDPADLAELITAIEEEFSAPEAKLEVSNEDIEGIVTVQHLIDYLHDYGIED